MRHRILAAGIWGYFCLLTGVWGAEEGVPQPLPPAPSADDQFLARQQIKTELRDRYAAAKSREGKTALVEALLERARAEEVAPALQFVLLDEARDAAVEAAQVDLALQAIDELAQRFDVDGIKIRMAALKSLEPRVKTPEAQAALANGLQQLSDDAAGADRYEVALESTVLAITGAAKAKDRLLATDLNERRRELQQALKESNAAHSAEQELQANPEDRNACRTLGTYLCLTKHDWERGLPLLAKGAAGKLQILADREADPPAEAAARLSFAEEWLEFAKTGGNKANAKFAARAVHWYQAAQEEAPEAVKLQCEKGLKEACEVRDADSPLGLVLAKLRPAIQSGKLKRIAPIGCGIPADDPGQPFEVTPPEGAALIGLNITLGPYRQYDVVHSVQPVFATASETIVGEMYGKPVGPIVKIRPRPGYIVTGLGIKAEDRIEEIGVQYTRLKKSGLDPKNSYWTRFYGGPTQIKIRALTSEGKPIVGLIGKSGNEIFTLGFVTAP
jgi:hypothetical protein